MTITPILRFNPIDQRLEELAFEECFWTQGFQNTCLFIHAIIYLFLCSSIYLFSYPYLSLFVHLLIFFFFFFFFFFFNCYLAAPRPTSGHYRGDSLTHPMLINAFLHIRPEGHREPRSEVGSLSPAERLVGFEPGTFRF